MPHFHLHLRFLAPDFPFLPPESLDPQNSPEITRHPSPEFPDNPTPMTKKLPQDPQPPRIPQKRSPRTKDAPITNYFGVCTFFPTVCCVFPARKKLKKFGVCTLRPRWALSRVPQHRSQNTKSGASPRRCSAHTAFAIPGLNTNHHE